MITVRWNGRLGNKLFQYALGRILAEDLGYELSCESIPGFPATSEGVTGKIVMPQVPIQGHFFYPHFVDENKEKFGFILDGWFQNYSYYCSKKEKVRFWYNRGFVHVPGKSTVVHLRRTQRSGLDTKVRYQIVGDTLRIENDLVKFNDVSKRNIQILSHDGSSVYANQDLIPFEWYEEILDGINFGKLYICSDNLNDPFINYFDKYKPIIMHGSEIEDFNFIRSADRILMSMSTFSWWSAFLSNATEIYMPKPDYGMWGPQSPCKLAVYDEPRFKMVPAIRTGKTLF